MGSASGSGQRGAGEPWLCRFDTTHPQMPALTWTLCRFDATHRCDLVALLPRQRHTECAYYLGTDRGQPPTGGSAVLSRHAARQLRRNGQKPVDSSAVLMRHTKPGTSVPAMADATRPLCRFHASHSPPRLV